MPTVTGLFRYPLKSGSAEALETAVLGERGFVGDREFMVVDPSGQFVTQRDCPRLATVRAVLEEDGDLTLSAPGRPSLHVVRPDRDDPRTTATVWEHTGPATRCSTESAAWLSAYLAREVALVCADSLDRFHEGLARRIAFVDEYPLVLASLESLADLERRVGADVPADRFRPNVVVEGLPAYDEDTWDTIRIGAVELACLGGRSRCPVVTIDQARGERTGDEPLRTLAGYRRTEGRSGGGVRFCASLSHRTLGELRLGDELEVTSRRPPE